MTSTLERTKLLQAEGKHKRGSQGDAGDESEDQQPWVRLYLERLFINEHNLVEDGINNFL